MKKKLLACASGGRTSMFQLEWLLENKRDEYDICGVFANTSWEHPKTIEFVNNCAKRWKLKYDFDLVWVEAKVIHTKGVGTKYSVVTYETCHQNQEIFEEISAKYGVPNNGFPHCTRELKEAPIHKYIKEFKGWAKGDYETALGMRIDEPRRLNYKPSPQNKVYPLVDWHPEQPDKLDIIDWWAEQAFDLNLPEHLGNCIGCYKKSKIKLMRVIRDEPELFKCAIEKNFGYVKPNRENGVYIDEPRTMYRQHMTSEKMIALFAETDPGYYTEKSSLDDESDNEGCASSCEPFASGEVFVNDDEF